MRRQKYSGYRTTNRSFTLVEMLVVIAIMCILMALLMPALRGALDSARIALCGNNLKQIGQGTLMYSETTRGWLPDGCGPYYAGGTSFDGKTSYPAADAKIYYSMGTWIIDKIGNLIQGFDAHRIEAATSKLYICPAMGGANHYFYAAHYATRGSNLWPSNEWGYYWNSARNQRDRTPGTAVIATDLSVIPGGSCYPGGKIAHGDSLTPRGINTVFLDCHAAFLDVFSCNVVGSSGQVQFYMPNP